MRYAVTMMSFAVAIGLAQSQSTVRTTFSVDVPADTNVQTRATTKRAEGEFWTEWRVVTNRLPPDPFSATNRPPQMDLMRSYCPLLHLDTSVQEETELVSSNLMAVTVWRGQTNRQLLYSVPITNIVRKWRWEAVKTYLP